MFNELSLQDQILLSKRVALAGYINTDKLISIRKYIPTAVSVIISAGAEFNDEGYSLRASLQFYNKDGNEVEIDEDSDDYDDYYDLYYDIVNGECGDEVEFAPIGFNFEEDGGKFYILENSKL